jgi:hypothetical protein
VIGLCHQIAEGLSLRTIAQAHGVLATMLCFFLNRPENVARHRRAKPIRAYRLAMKP